jgi:alpha-L-arabinofuranosidase
VSSADKVLHLKLVNASTVDQPLQVTLGGVSGARKAKVTSLHGATFEATNSMREPENIHPVESTVAVAGREWKHTVPALTIEVVDVAF